MTVVIAVGGFEFCKMMDKCIRKSTQMKAKAERERPKQAADPASTHVSFI